MTAKPPTWRVLSAEELKSDPDANLGGALAVIFCAAIGIVVADVARVSPAVLAVAVMGGPAGLLEMLAMPFALPLTGPPHAFVQQSFLLSQTVLFAWALVFVVMTALRSPRTPVAAAVGLGVYLAVAIIVAVAVRIVLQPGNVLYLLDAVPGSLLNVATFAAFWVYMRDARRPNLYFLGRVRT